MLKHSFLIFSCLLGFAILPQTLFAKTSKASVREKYSSTEDDGTATLIDANTNAEDDQPRDQSLAQVVQQDAEKQEAIKKEAKKKALQVQAKTAEKPALAGDDVFDAVPKEKIGEITERVKYTYEILKRFGRAYDYRVTTLTELKKILRDLEDKDLDSHSDNSAS